MRARVIRAACQMHHTERFACYFSQREFQVRQHHAVSVITVCMPFSLRPATQVFTTHDEQHASTRPHRQLVPHRMQRISCDISCHPGTPSPMSRRCIFVGLSGMQQVVRSCWLSSRATATPHAASCKRHAFRPCMQYSAPACSIPPLNAALRLCIQTHGCMLAGPARMQQTAGRHFAPGRLRAPRAASVTHHACDIARLHAATAMQERTYAMLGCVCVCLSVCVCVYACD